MKLIGLHIILLSVLAFSIEAQHNPLISQYMLNGLPLNPAFTGSREALSVSGSYRNQWVGFEGAPVTHSIGVHTPLRKESLALGLLIFGDKLGITRENGLQASCAYRTALRDGKLSMGLSGGLSFIQNAWSDIQTTQENDEAFAFGNDQYILPNFSAGLYYYTSKYYVSFSAPFMMSAEYVGGTEYRTRNDIKEYNLFLNGGYRFRLNDNLQLTPSIMTRYKQGSPVQFDFNAMLMMGSIFETGISYRTGDAAVILIKANPTEQLTLGYSFDYTLSKLNNYNNGTHEITLSYDFKYRSTASNPRFF